MEMWCPDDIGRDSWDWVGPPAWVRACFNSPEWSGGSSLVKTEPPPDCIIDVVFVLVDDVVDVVGVSVDVVDVVDVVLLMLVLLVLFVLLVLMMLLMWRLVMLLMLLMLLSVVVGC